MLYLEQFLRAEDKRIYGYSPSDSNMAKEKGHIQQSTENIFRMKDESDSVE